MSILAAALIIAAITLLNLAYRRDRASMTSAQRAEHDEYLRREAGIW